MIFNVKYLLSGFYSELKLKPHHVTNKHMPIVSVPIEMYVSEFEFSFAISVSISTVLQKNTYSILNEQLILMPEFMIV